MGLEEPQDLKTTCHSLFRLAAAVDFGTEVKQAL